jgi:hypothetical protein
MTPEIAGKLLELDRIMMRIDNEPSVPADC